jgi:hypothetical protein
MAERYQLPRSGVPPATRRKGSGRPPPGGARKVERHDACGEREDMVALQGGRPPFLKAALPTCTLNRCGSSLLQHAPRFTPPHGAGAGSHTSCKPVQERRSQTVVRGTCNRPAVTSSSPLLPRPTGERAGSHAGGMQPRQVGAPLRLPTSPAWRSRPTRHATGAPVATCEQLHRHSRHYRTSSTAESIPQLEATLQCQAKRDDQMRSKLGRQ